MEMTPKVWAVPDISYYQFAVYWGQLFKAGLALALGCNLNQCFSLCISVCLFISEVREENSHCMI